jgi:hypothetical protein
MGNDHMPDTQGIAGAHHGGHQPVDLHHIGPDRAKDLAKQIDARGAQLCVCSSSVSPGKGKRTDHTTMPFHVPDCSSASPASAAESMGSNTVT